MSPLAITTKGVPVIVLASAPLPAAPPTAYLPDANGVSVPPGCSGLEILVDLSKAQATDLIDVHIEFHTAGAWPVSDQAPYRHGAMLRGGTFTSDRTGQPETVKWITVTGEGAFPIPYPDAARVAIRLASGQTVPTLTVRFF